MKWLKCKMCGGDHWKLIWKWVIMKKKREWKQDVRQIKKIMEFLIQKIWNSHKIRRRWQAAMCSSAQEILFKKKCSANEMGPSCYGRTERWRDETICEARGVGKDNRLQTPNSESAAFRIIIRMMPLKFMFKHSQTYSLCVRRLKLLLLLLLLWLTLC